MPPPSSGPPPNPPAPQPTAGDAAPTGATLAERIERLLGPLGGRSAVAARAFPAGATQPATTPTPAAREILLRASDPFPAASLAKLPLAVEVLRRVDLGALHWAERFDLGAAPRAGGGSVLDTLDPTWRPSLADLCALMLSVSDNTAANMLLDLVGMGEVNETATRLGLTATRLQRRFMDAAARAAGRDNLTTAGDMLTLLALLRGDAVPGAARLRGLLQHDPLTEATTSDLPSTAELAHKGGALDDTIHAAGLLAGPGGACAYCVLTTQQRDLPLATLVCARVLRLLWDAWCAPVPA